MRIYSYVFLTQIWKIRFSTIFENCSGQFNIAVRFSVNDNIYQMRTFANSPRWYPQDSMPFLRNLYWDKHQHYSKPQTAFLSLSQSQLFGSDLVLTNPRRNEGGGWFNVLKHLYYMVFFLLHYFLHGLWTKNNDLPEELLV